MDISLAVRSLLTGHEFPTVSDSVLGGMTGYAWHVW